MLKKDDSSTGVNYPQSVFSGVRKTVGFKCDTGLYSAFKSAAQAYFGSVCRPLEIFMLAVLALNKEQVNFGKTVVIEHLNIERNLRERRSLAVEADEVKPVEVKPDVAKCYFCGKIPVKASFRYVTGVEKQACSSCADRLRDYSKWKLLMRE